jgi:hypothetical protein
VTVLSAIVATKQAYQIPLFLLSLVQAAIFTTAQAAIGQEMLFQPANPALTLAQTLCFPAGKVSTLNTATDIPAFRGPTMAIGIAAFILAPPAIAGAVMAAVPTGITTVLATFNPVFPAVMPSVGAALVVVGNPVLLLVPFLLTPLAALFVGSPAHLTICTAAIIAVHTMAISAVGSIAICSVGISAICAPAYFTGGNTVLAGGMTVGMIGKCGSRNAGDEKTRGQRDNNAAGRPGSAGSVLNN